MVTDSSADYATLVDRMVARTRLSWLHVSIGIGLMLILLLTAAMYLDGFPAGFLQDPSWWRSWLGDVDQPVIMVYILLTYHLLGRSHRRAVRSLGSLMGLDDDGLDHLLIETHTLSQRREWLALGIGAVIGLLVQRPWSLPDPLFWRRSYLFASTTLMYGLMGWIVYVSLASSRQFAELHRRPLVIDIFDPTPLEPVARWSLGISSVFIGGITLSVVFNPTADEFFSLEGILIYGTLTLVAFLLFFLTMANTHRVMVETKEQKLRLVRRNLSATFQQLQEQSAEGQLRNVEAYSDAITAWLAYEKRLEDAPEWPYTSDTVRNLLMSTLLPLAAWGAQILVEFIT